MRWLTEKPGGFLGLVLLIGGRSQNPENSGATATHWWVKLGPEASARLLVGRAGSWRLVVWPRGFQSWCQIAGEWAWFLTQLDHSWDLRHPEALSAH